jgi:hypothetical protein
MRLSNGVTEVGRASVLQRLKRRSPESKHSARQQHDAGQTIRALLAGKPLDRLERTQTFLDTRLDPREPISVGELRA